MEKIGNDTFKYNGKLYRMVKNETKHPCSDICPLYVELNGCWGHIICSSMYKQLENPQFKFDDAVLVEVTETEIKETNMEKDEIDYKKLYEEALERAKFLKENTDGVGAKDVSRCFEAIFPELKESEDEVMKGKLREILRLCYAGSNCSICTSDYEKILAWLEKQEMKESGYKWDAENKELRKIEYDVQLTEFEKEIKYLMNNYRDAIGDNDATIEEIKSYAAYLLSLIHQNPAWSEEDEAMLDSALWACEDNCSTETYNWLKSLKQRMKG